MKKITWRRVLAVPVALTLALGGALFAAVPANAAGTLTITAPTNGSTTSSRTVDVMGTAPANSIVRVFTAQGGTVLNSETLTNGATAFSIPVTYSPTDPVAESVYVDGLNGLSGFSNPQTINFNIPAAAVTFSNTAPTDGTTLTSRSTTFTGTAPTGSTVTVTDATDTELGRTNVTGGAYTIPVTFAADAPVAQTVTVSGFQGGAGFSNPAIVHLTLPAVAVGNTLTLATPVAASTTTTRTVTFSGTAPATSIVRVQAADGTELGRTTMTGTTTNYSFTVTFPDTAAVAQTVTVNSFAGGRGADNTVTRSFTLPAAVTPPTPVLATPVITSPTNGQKIVGTTVTFSGTGTVGSHIVLVVIPTNIAKQLAAGDLTGAEAAAQGKQVKITNNAPIVVGADGKWTITTGLAPADDYTVIAIAALLNADGTPVVDAKGLPVLSLPSAPVEFVLTSPAVITTAATGATSTGSLAFTGSNLSPFLGLCALLLLAGGVLTVITRRKRNLLR